MSNNLATDRRCVYYSSLGQHTSIHNELEGVCKAAKVRECCILHSLDHIGSVISNNKVDLLVFNLPVCQHLFVLGADIFPSVCLVHWLSMQHYRLPLKGVSEPVGSETKQGVIAHFGAPDIRGKTEPQNAS